MFKDFKLKLNAFNNSPKRLHNKRVFKRIVLPLAVNLKNIPKNLNQRTITFYKTLKRL